MQKGAKERTKERIRVKLQTPTLLGRALRRCRRMLLRGILGKVLRTLKTPTSLNKEVRFPLFLPLAITAFGDLDGCCSLAIVAFGVFELIVPDYYYRLGKMDKRSLDSLISGGYGLYGFSEIPYPPNLEGEGFTPQI